MDVTKPCTVIWHLAKNIYRHDEEGGSMCAYFKIRGEIGVHTLDCEGPRVPLKGPRGPLKGPRGPFKGPRGPFKGPLGPLKGPRGPLKGGPPPKNPFPK